jgi:hypothetical protein
MSELQSCCCEDMKTCLAYDGPIANCDVGWIMAEYHLTKSKKSISHRVGSKRIVLIRYCPFCGKELWHAPKEAG